MSVHVPNAATGGIYKLIPGLALAALVLVIIDVIVGGDLHQWFFEFVGVI